MQAEASAPGPTLHIHLTCDLVQYHTIHLPEHSAALGQMSARTTFFCSQHFPWASFPAMKIPSSQSLPLAPANC